jgi:hypothetical protein
MVRDVHSSDVSIRAVYWLARIAPVAHSIAQVPAATCSAAVGNVSEYFLCVRGRELRRMGGATGMINGCAEIGPFRLMTSTETLPRRDE